MDLVGLEKAYTVILNYRRYTVPSWMLVPERCRLLMASQHLTLAHISYTLGKGKEGERKRRREEDTLG